MGKIKEEAKRIYNLPSKEFNAFVKNVHTTESGNYDFELDGHLFVLFNDTMLGMSIIMCLGQDWDTTLTCEHYKYVGFVIANDKEEIIAQSLEIISENF